MIKVSKVSPQDQPSPKPMESSPELTKKDAYIFASLFAAAQAVGIVCIILVAVWITNYAGGFAWQEDPSHEFNFHPMFMVLGMVFLYGNAILIYRVLRSVQKPILKLLHAGLHMTAFIFTVVALKAVFDSHNLPEPPFPNLYSLHSWIGLTTVILFSINFVGGFTAFLFPGASRAMRAQLITKHVFFGVMIFVMAIASCLTGINEKLILSLGSDYSKFKPPGVMLNCLGLCLIVFAGLVVYLVSTSKYKRQPLPEESVLPLMPQSPLN